MIKKGKTVQQAKRLGVYACQEQETLAVAAQHMIAEDISSLVVVDREGFLAGILTRVDLLRAYMKLDDWNAHPVSEFMIRGVITVGPDDLLTDVADLLLEKGIHRVVVVTMEGGRKRPVAVVSAADLVYHMVKADGQRWMRGVE